jgi:uncharacterized protein YjdB
VWIAPAAAAAQTAGVVINPQSDTIATVGGTAQLVGVVVDAQGSPIVGQTATWSSLDSEIAGVSGSGLVTSKARGRARIAARTGTFADTADVWVQPVAVATSLRIIPRQDTIPTVGGTITLEAMLLDSDGDEIYGAGVTWRALGDIVRAVGSGTPSPTTVVTAQASGSGRIVANYGLLADTATIVVAPSSGAPAQPAKVVMTPENDTVQVGANVQFTARVLDASNVPISGMSVTWSSLDPAIATPNQYGLVRGVAPGTARIRANYGIFADTSRVLVTAAPPPVSNRLVITPGSGYLASTGAKLQLAATVFDNLGAVVSGAVATWRSLDVAVGTVSSAGLVTAAGNGTARIVASYSALADTAWISVSTTPPSSGSLTPAPLLSIVGPLIGRMPSTSQDPAIRTYDGRFDANEQGRFDDFIACQATCLYEPNHYGGLRSRLAWSIRNGLPFGPSAPDASVYGHGRRIVRRYLQTVSPDHNERPDRNTGLADIEALWRLEGDTAAFNHIWGSGHTYIDDRYGYQSCISSGSDPRQAAVPLQAFNIAHRLRVPFQRFPQNGSGWDGTPGSWKAAGDRQIGYIRNNCVQPNGAILSKAHGTEAFLFNAMVAVELLAWARDVEFRQEYVDLARLIIDHIIDYHATYSAPKGWPTLPYLAGGTYAAVDLAGYYIWPSLVLWQETGDVKYKNFGLSQIAAANKAWVTAAGTMKQFNQTFSTLGMGAETLLQGVRWR